MDTLLTILGGFVLVCCLAYFHDQDKPRRDDRLFESADLMLPKEDDADEPVPFPAVPNQVGGSLES